MQLSERDELLSVLIPKMRSYAAKYFYKLNRTNDDWTGIQLEDLRSVMLVGAVDALNRYEPGPMSAANFAWLRAKGEMQNFIAKELNWRYSEPIFVGQFSRNAFDDEGNAEWEENLLQSTVAIADVLLTQADLVAFCIDPAIAGDRGAYLLRRFYLDGVDRVHIAKEMHLSRATVIWHLKAAEHRVRAAVTGRHR